MKADISCPSNAELRQLLDDGDPALAGHLERCPRCQQALENLVADADSWGELPGSLRRELATGPALQRVIAGLKGHAVPAVEGLSDVQPFLGPPTRAGAIGRLGSYDILELIGRGGMSVVLKAFDASLNRHVAIKMLAPHLASSGPARQRFTREARAVAAVCHEHVVAVHAVEDGGELPYLVMEYVPGKSLQQRLDREGALPLREVLRIGYQVASALAAAHAQGLVHRDVKPANILLENGVERVRLGDFGLARAAADAGLTEAGVVSGTPQYMAPEQARGETVDARADLFSLGSVLYAMCTGRPPFVGDTPLAIVSHVCHDSPPGLRKLNAEVPAWLEAIVVRLHAKKPEERFASASEVAELLRGCLAHVQQPAVVALPAVSRRRRRFPRLLPRGRFGRWAVATLIVLLCLAGLGLWWFWDVLHYKVRAVAYAPDGRWLAVATERGVQMWEPRATRATMTLNIHGPYDTLLAFSPDGKRMVTATHGGMISLWNLNARKATDHLYLGALDAGERLALVGFTDAGGKVLAVTERGRLYQWDFETRNPLPERGLEFPPPNPDQRAGPTRAGAALSPDGTWLAWWDLDYAPSRANAKVIVQSLVKDRILEFPAGEVPVLAAAFSPDGKRLAWGGHRGRVSIGDLDDNKVPAQGLGHRGSVYSLAFSPDGKHLAVGNGDGKLTLWEPATGKLIATVGRHWGDVYSVSFSPDGRTIATGSRGNKARLWDVSVWMR